MAIFRAITAEEEAATGLLRALQARGYADSREIQPRDHLQKAAVYPYLRAIAKHTSYLRMNGVKEVRLGIPKNEEKQDFSWFFFSMEITTEYLSTLILHSIFASAKVARL